MYMKLFSISVVSMRARGHLPLLSITQAADPCSLFQIRFEEVVWDAVPGPTAHTGQPKFWVYLSQTGDDSPVPRCRVTASPGVRGYQHC